MSLHLYAVKFVETNKIVPFILDLSHYPLTFQLEISFNMLPYLLYILFILFVKCYMFITLVFFIYRSVLYFLYLSLYIYLLISDFMNE